MQWSPVVEKPGLLNVEDFQIVQVSHDLEFSVPEEGYEASIECLFREIILGLPTSDVPEPFPKEK